MNPLHIRASVSGCLAASKERTCCTVSHYIDQDNWSVQATWASHPTQDPMSVALMTFAPWWPSQRDAFADTVQEEADPDTIPETRRSAIVPNQEDQAA